MSYRVFLCVCFCIVISNILSYQMSVRYVFRVGMSATISARKRCSIGLYLQLFEGARVAQWVRSLDLATHTSLSPLRRGFTPIFVNYKKGYTRLAAASDKVYQLVAQGWWFSPGTPISSTTKTGRHDIAEILLKVALSIKIQIQIPVACRRTHVLFTLFVFAWA